MALGEDLEELPVELVLAIWGVRMSPVREGAGREGIRTRPVLSMPGSTPGYSTQVTPVLGSTDRCTRPVLMERCGVRAVGCAAGSGENTLSSMLSPKTASLTTFLAGVAGSLVPA